MKIINQYYICFIFLFTFVNKVISGGSDWMANVNDSLKLNQINIPGTHDSATFDLLFDVFSDEMAKTQKLNIKEQLAIGVRYFDIRLGNFKMFDSEDININHGPADSEITFKEVLRDCREFLKDHKTETVILHLKNEGECQGSYAVPLNQGPAMVPVNCGKKKSAAVNKLIEGCYTKEEIPKLGDEGVRGNIVIVTREKGDYGYNGIPINVSSNNESIEPVSNTCAKNYDCKFQDGYELPLDKKWDAIKKLIDQQKDIVQGSKDGENKLAINFMSTSDGDLEDVATEINRRFVNEKPLIYGRQYGWIIADFINEEVAKVIYESNSNILNEAVIEENTAENNINETIEEEYAINTENNIFTEEQVKHLYNGDEAHDRCIRKIKDVVWYRSEKSSIKEHLKLDNIEKYCKKHDCVKAYEPEGSCESKEEYWNKCKKEIVSELNTWIPGNWKVKDINHC